MPAHEQTSPDVASLAARLLREPWSATADEVKRLAASALTQAPDRVADAPADAVHEGETAREGAREGGD